jgi:hypothetical protein
MAVKQTMVEYVLKSYREGQRLEITQPPPKFERTTFHPSQDPSVAAAAAPKSADSLALGEWHEGVLAGFETVEVREWASDPRPSPRHACRPCVPSPLSSVPPRNLPFGLSHGWFSARVDGVGSLCSPLCSPQANLVVNHEGMLTLLELWANYVRERRSHPRHTFCVIPAASLCRAADAACLPLSVAGSRRRGFDPRCRSRCACARWPRCRPCSQWSSSASRTHSTFSTGRTHECCRRCRRSCRRSAACSLTPWGVAARCRHAHCERVVQTLKKKWFPSVVDIFRREGKDVEEISPSLLAAVSTLMFNQLRTLLAASIDELVSFFERFAMEDDFSEAEPPPEVLHSEAVAHR